MAGWSDLGITGMSETVTKTLAEMAAEVDAYCQDKGWREDEISFREAMALLHTEIAEASDAWRRWGTADATGYTHSRTEDGSQVAVKPEGVGSEFADIFIRLLDDCVIFGVDLDVHLARHFGLYALSDSFLENMDALHGMVTGASLQWSMGDGDHREQFAAILVFLRQLCEVYGIDLEAEYERKMAYNRTRSYRNGGKRA